MSGPVSQRTEDNIIEAFVTYLAAKLYPGIQVADWPDKTNSRTPDIDAIAEGGGRRIAIEHTSADSFPNQRRHDERFMKSIGSLEQELKGRINFRLRIITPFGVVPTDIRWDEIRGRIRRWILHDATKLPTGEVMHNITIEGVPFSLTVQKPESSSHGLFLARSVGEDLSFPERLQSQIDRKALKLTKYRGCCTLLILLIDNVDIANMSRGKMIKTIKELYSHCLPSGLDRVWYADSSIPASIQFWNVTPASRANMMDINATEELDGPPE